MIPVIVESPYAPRVKKPTVEEGCQCTPSRDQCDPCERYWAWHRELDENLEYARAALKDCLHRGEAPYASHLLYTQPGVLDDTVPEERRLGMQAGFTWNERALKTVVYVDRGISNGMREGIKNAGDCNRPVEIRTLGPEWRNELGHEYFASLKETNDDQP